MVSYIFKRWNPRSSLCRAFGLWSYLLFPTAHRFLDGRSAQVSAVVLVSIKEDGQEKSPRRHILRSTVALVYLSVVFMVPRWGLFSFALSE